ncbi:MAG TPA: hypothetical protein VK119_09685 [Bacillota bacterium]|nr:hypothetical protein [Bacillota bacterium]
MKFYGYQILGIGIIWAGMAFFFQEMDQAGKLIFYVVTSWLLLLIVLFVKTWIRKNDRSNETPSED